MRILLTWQLRIQTTFLTETPARTHFPPAHAAEANVSRVWRKVRRPKTDTEMNLQKTLNSHVSPRSESDEFSIRIFGKTYIHFTDELIQVHKYLCKQPRAAPWSVECSYPKLSSDFWSGSSLLFSVSRKRMRQSKTILIESKFSLSLSIGKTLKLNKFKVLHCSGSLCSPTLWLFPSPPTLPVLCWLFENSKPIFDCLLQLFLEHTKTCTHRTFTFVLVVSFAHTGLAALCTTVKLSTECCISCKFLLIRPFGNNVSSKHGISLADDVIN